MLLVSLENAPDPGGDFIEYVETKISSFYKTTKRVKYYNAPDPGGV